MNMNMHTDICHSAHTHILDENDSLSEYNDNDNDNDNEN